MRFTYGQEGGRESWYLSPDELFPAPVIIHFILKHGQEGLDSLADADEQVRRLVEQMIDAGLLERDGDDGRLVMTPRMVKGIEHRAFLEIFREMRRDYRGAHHASALGRSPERSDGYRPYQFGDPISELAINPTLRNAIQRRAREGGDAGADTSHGGLLPLRLARDDFELHNTESTGESATAILIDLSGSMMRYGRFIQAKRVALGMKALVERRFPTDRLYFIGFSSRAERIAESELPLVMPKPITIRDWEVRLCVPLSEAGRAPQHFTNLHHGLRMARATLARDGAANKQVFIITDGQPTAHLETTASGDEMLHLIYPPAESTWRITLEEAMRLHRQDIRLSTFALIEDYYYMDWVGFVEQLTRLTRGVAYYCTAGDLAGAIMESYLAGKRRRTSLGA